MNNEQRILDYVSTAIIELDEELRIAYINSAAEDLFGHSMRQLKGVSALSIFAASPGMIEALRYGQSAQQSYSRR
jgi:PAS domain S-box-containing protein